MAFKKRLIGVQYYYIDNEAQRALPEKEWVQAGNRYAKLVARLAAQKILNK